MHRPTNPRSPVQSQRSMSCLPFVIAGLAALLFWGWSNSDFLTDRWDGEPSAGSDGPARASANLVAIFSTDDYPLEAIRNEEQGTVSFRLAISRRGRVADCDIVQGSGSRILDAQTCRIIMERARFSPARDASGQRVEDSYSGRIRWELPE